MVQGRLRKQGVRTMARRGGILVDSPAASAARSAHTTAASRRHVRILYRASGGSETPVYILADRAPIGERAAGFVWDFMFGPHHTTVPNAYGYLL